MIRGLRRAPMLGVLAASAAAMSGCSGIATHEPTSDLTQGTLTVQAPSQCKAAQPYSLSVNGHARIEFMVTNTAPAIGVGNAFKTWPGTFVLLDPGPTLRLDHLYNHKPTNPPDQQVGKHEYSFASTMPQSSRVFVADLTAIKPGTRKLTISSWGGSDPADIPAHPPSATCTVIAG